MERSVRTPRRLLAAMRWVACLSHSEAEACLRDWRAGQEWSGEAVNHYGGNRVVIEYAIAMRDTYRMRRDAESAGLIGTAVVLDRQVAR